MKDGVGVLVRDILGIDQYGDFHVFFHRYLCFKAYRKRVRCAGALRLNSMINQKRSLKRASVNEHSITEREQAILAFDGVSISFHDVIARGESRNEHHERRARNVKIRNERINHIEGIAREDKQVGGLAFTCDQLARFVIPGTFEATNARGAYCDHAPAVFLRALDRVDRLLGHAVVFGVHVVFVGIFGLHYAEGVEPYFEVHGFEANTLLLKAFDKLRGEMEPCCGSSCALLFA